MTEQEKLNLLNQCGPDGPLNSIIPNSLLGLDISDVCDVHDWMFVQAKNSRELKEADEVFLKNLKNKVQEHTALLPLRLLRDSLVYIYFAAVRLYSIVQSKVGDRSHLDK